MQSEILIMRPDEPNEKKMVEFEEGRFASLRDLVEAIVGEPFEHVNVFADFDGGTAFRYCDMFVNELGHLSDLERNENATIIYRRNALMHIRDCDPEELPWIAGPAVLFRQRVWR